MKGTAIVLCLLFFAFFTAAFFRAELKAPQSTLLLLDRNGRYLGETGNEEGRGYGYWPLKGMPDRVVAATLALEDHRFWKHFGVDPFAIGRAFWQNLKSGRRVSGASTIAMQVARMQEPGGRTYFNKAIESITATLITFRFGREEVLKHYLRIVPYGNNSHGIAYASRKYFDKPLEDLSWAEIAFLSALPQAPGKTNPFTGRGKERAGARGKRILKALRLKNVISKEEYALAMSQIEGLKIPGAYSRPADAIHAILKLERELQNQYDEAGKFPEPRIISTLDLALQIDVDNMAIPFLERWREKGAENLALIVADRSTMEVLAWIGSSDYFNSEAGAIDYARTLRSPGSALKPFIYALALERGQITPGTILYDIPARSSGVHNADMRFLGPMLPRYALANSRNVPAANLLKLVGIDEVYLLFRNLGLHDNQWPARYYGLGMAIGGMPVTLESLVAAYGALANDGLLQTLNWVRKGGDKEGKLVISPATARLISLYLSDPLARMPSFPRMGTTEYPFPVAVKTGTSQGYRDAWAVAYSNRYIVGVWTGRPDAKSMDKLGGAGSAAHLAQAVMLHLHEKQSGGMADLNFLPPSDYEAVQICAISGKKSTGSCKPTIEEWFPQGQLPEEDDSMVTLAIDSRNNLLATPWTPKDKIAWRNFLNLPAPLSEWAVNNHLPVPPPDFSHIDVPEKKVAQARPILPIKASLKPVAEHISVTVTSPEDKLSIFINPEVPDALNSLALRASVEPSVPQIVWYVDGEPYQVAEHPYTVRWPLKRGSHTFQARVPYREDVSMVVEVNVE